MSGKYALIIANTEYSDPGLLQLTAPGHDAEDFARVLRDPSIGAFDHVNILLNQPSYTAIEAIDEFFSQRKPDDLLVAYFSGHGVRDELGSLFLAVKNTNRSKLRSTAIRSDYIREVMDQSRSRRQVLILDCCNSGAFPQGTKAEVGGTMGIVSAFQGYGRYVLTASDATQFAWEGNQVIGETTNNSLFTHFLVKGLEGEADRDGDGKITVDELYDYAFEQIVHVTPKQKPSKSASRQEGEIILRQFIRMEDIRPISLPEELVEAMDDPRTFVREGAVQQLAKIMSGRNLGLARSAREALERIEKEDDSRRVSQVATQVLESFRQAEEVEAQKVEAERKAQAEREAYLEAEREADEKASQEKVEHEAAEREETQRAKRVAVELALREKAEHERMEFAARQQAKEKVIPTQGTTAFPQPSVLRQPVMKWAVIAILGLVVIGAAALAVPYNANLFAPITPVATEPPATEAPAREPVVTEIPTENPAANLTGTLYIWAYSPYTVALQALANKVSATSDLELVIEDKSNLRNDFLISAAAGEGPDIFIDTDDGIGIMLADGLLAPVDFGDHSKDFTAEALEACTVNGVLYCMPYVTENSAFFYNTSLVPTPPSTWDEVMTMGESLKAAGQADYIMAITGSTYDLYPLYTSFGGYIFGKDENGKWNKNDIGIDSPGMIAGVQWLTDNTANGNLPSDWDWENNHALFESGRVPFIMTGPWSLNRIRDSGIPYAITNFPSGGYSMGGIQGFFINARSENIELAQAFLNELVATEDTMLMLSEAGMRPPAYLPALERITDPDLAAFAAAGKRSDFLFSFPAMRSVWSDWNDAVIYARDGNKNVEDALKDATENIRALTNSP